MTQKSIIIKGGQGMQKELPLKASTDITPGMLIERDAGYYKPHAGGIAPVEFALESPYIHSPVAGTKAIDTDYDTDLESVIGYTALPGDEIYALVADGQTIAADDVLESDGAGALQALGYDEDSGVKASLFVDGAAANGGLTFTAKVGGSQGNNIYVIVADAGTGSVAIDGNIITITPDSGANTATEVVAQVVADAGAAALISAVAEGTGAGEPGTDTGSYLTGGADAQAVCRATEAVDNSVGGAVARIKVEVL